MKQSIQVHFIGSEADVAKLNELRGAPLIGMDSEWRPTVKPFADQRLAILQLSSELHAFVIDLIALKDNVVLDVMLTEIFTNENSLCLGFSFGSDTSMFKNSLPQMSFYKRFARFLDVQTYWQAVKQEKNQIGLAKVVETLFDKPLCKGEQMSNWEKRPLRMSQLHYASLDAACLPPLVMKMAELAGTQPDAAKLTIENFTRELIFGKKLEVPIFTSDPQEKTVSKKDRKKRKRGPRKNKESKEREPDSESFATRDSSFPATDEERKE